MLVSFFGSALAGLASYSKSDDRMRRMKALEKLLDFIASARKAETIQALDELQSEMDEVHSEMVREVENNDLDETDTDGLPGVVRAGPGSDCRPAGHSDEQSAKAARGGCFRLADHYIAPQQQRGPVRMAFRPSVFVRSRPENRFPEPLWTFATSPSSPTSTTARPRWSTGCSSSRAPIATTSARSSGRWIPTIWSASAASPSWPRPRRSSGRTPGSTSSTRRATPTSAARSSASSTWWTARWCWSTPPKARCRRPSSWCPRHSRWVSSRSW